MPLCLTAGTITAWVGVQAFTLAWMHSIEKIRWEEDWRIEGRALVAVAARIAGAGAGMEPPPGAVLKDGVWHYRPALPPQPRLRLTHSPHAAGYQLCVDGRCAPLAERLPGLDNIATIDISVCPP